MSGVTRNDRLLALGLGAWVALDCGLNPTPAPTVVAVVLGLVSVLPMLRRRAHPLEAALAVSALVVLRGAVGSIPEPTSSTLPLVVFAVFSAATYAVRPRDALVAVAACALATAVGISLSVEGPLDPLDFVVVPALLGGAFAAGLLIGRRTAETGALRASGRAALLARDEQARAAIADERARIARELHDVLAHSVSIISVQAGAAERQALKDPDRARAAVAQVRRTADEAQADLGRLLDVLRGTSDAPAGTPPGLLDLERLVAEARAAGHPVELRVERDDGSDVPDGVALAAYRIVQEALTNVRKHAGAVPTDVVLRGGGGELHVEVSNLPGEAAGGGTGLGLVGMGERVRIHGGRLHAGPDETGRWAVEATLPLETTA